MTMSFELHLHSLRSVDLSCSQQLTEKGLLKLTGMEELRHSAVTNCPGVSAARSSACARQCFSSATVSVTNTTGSTV